MIAAVYLFLALSAPGEPTRATVFAMPSMRVCRKALAAFQAGEPDAHAIGEPNTRRTGMCITVPTLGRDA